MNLNEQLNRMSVLMENRNAAEKYLKEKGIPLDTPFYVQLKNELVKNNNIGYLGTFTRMVFDSNDPGYNFTVLIRLYRNQKDYFKRLPKPLEQYSLQDLRNEFEKMERLKVIKPVADRIINKKIKQELIQIMLGMNEDDFDFYEIEFETFDGFTSSKRMEFTKKIDQYQNANDFLTGLVKFNTKAKDVFNYTDVLSKINTMKDVLVKFTDEQKEQILIQVETYEASKALGSTSWCIVGDEDRWNDYVKIPGDNQYFFFDFKAKDDLVMIGFTMDANNTITASHDRYDGEFKNPKEYLKSIGILPKVYEVNGRNSKIRYLNNIHNDTVKGFTFINNMGSVEILPNKVDINDKLFDKASKLLKDLDVTEHLDIITKNYEDVSITIIAYSSIKGEVSEKQKFNVLSFLFINYEKVLHDGKVNLQMLIKAALKIYNSGIQLKTETTRDLMGFLSKNGYEPLTLSKQKKSKYNKDLSPMEFGMSVKRNDNLKPYITNKMGAWRRGEDVDFNPNEIMYAIDNGYGDFFKEYYTKDLNEDPYQAVDYDQMKIYQKLGLMNQVTKAIVNKVNEFGVDGLNSIELSIYQHRK